MFALTFQLAAFTTQWFVGSPAAVTPKEAVPTNDLMQALAVKSI
jgi:predicted PhzF superfamily epimerase YddE/YHI9